MRLIMNCFLTTMAFLTDYDFGFSPVIVLNWKLTTRLWIWTMYVGPPLLTFQWMYWQDAQRGGI